MTHSVSLRVDISGASKKRDAHPERMEIGHEIRKLGRILDNFIDPFSVSGEFVRVHQNILHHARINDAPEKQQQTRV